LPLFDLNIDSSISRDLNEREQSILRTIINLYIINATPIGSRNLSKFLENNIKLSPATIRNIMADLEQMDYISHPHTSAGRVPTDKGYRYYVDNLIDKDISLTNEFKSIADELEQSSNESILKDAGKLLGLISHYLAIVRVPELTNIIIKKIELLKLSSNHILIVVAFDSNFVKTITMEISYVVSEKAINILNSFINEKLAGKDYNYINQHYKYIAGELGIDSSSPIIGLFVDSIDKIISNNNTNDKLHIVGTQNLLNLPEFENIYKIRSLMELTENEDVLISVIDNSGKYNPDVKILIGSEMNNNALDDFSMIVSSYKLGKATGSIGLIGPRRMNYSKVISLVKYVSDTISSK